MILDPKATGVRPSFATKADVDEFVDVLEQYERGEIDAAKFREFRLTRGVYGQRQSEKNMIRVKLPQGIVTSAQLRVMGSIAREKSRGFGHVTTRQSIQFHMIALQHLQSTTKPVIGSLKFWKEVMIFPAVMAVQVAHQQIAVLSQAACKKLWVNIAINDPFGTVMHNLA